MNPFVSQVSKYSQCTVMELVVCVCVCFRMQQFVLLNLIRELFCFTWLLFKMFLFIVRTWSRALARACCNPTLWSVNCGMKSELAVNRNLLWWKEFKKGTWICSKMTSLLLISHFDPRRLWTEELFHTPNSLLSGLVRVAGGYGEGLSCLRGVGGRFFVSLTRR